MSPACERNVCNSAREAACFCSHSTRLSPASCSALSPLEGILPALVTFCSRSCTMNSHTVYTGMWDPSSYEHHVGDRSSSSRDSSRPRRDPPLLFSPVMCCSARCVVISASAASAAVRGPEGPGVSGSACKSTDSRWSSSALIEFLLLL